MNTEQLDELIKAELFGRIPADHPALAGYPDRWQSRLRHMVMNIDAQIAERSGRVSALEVEHGRTPEWRAALGEFRAWRGRAVAVKNRAAARLQDVNAQIKQRNIADSEAGRDDYATLLRAAIIRHRDLIVANPGDDQDADKWLWAVLDGDWHILTIDPPAARP